MQSIPIYANSLNNRHRFKSAYTSAPIFFVNLTSAKYNFIINA